ncbi:hypothetical protein ABT010_32940 [Streptomyces sp. NPDC002668]|uniref:hypothetical protein n=1 Tax=Streptomyces sp. NPDC002668 TaxID=3154422 RepID=UPI00332C5E3B
MSTPSSAACADDTRQRRRAYGSRAAINRRSHPAAPEFADAGWYLNALRPLLLPAGPHGHEAS